MNKPKSDFKVFVSDEILDFRTLEEKYNRTSPLTSLHRTQSHEVIGGRLKKDAHAVGERLITPLEKLSKTLYTSLPTVADIYRNPRQKNRSKTVDPRFRKSRSPTHKLLTASQSTSDINTPSMSQSQAKKKSLSTSYLAAANRDIRKLPKCTKGSKETKAEPTVDTPREHVVPKEEKKPCNKFTVLDDVQETKGFYDEQNQYRKHTGTSPEQYSRTCVGDSANVSSTGPPEITEDEIIEESDSLNDAGDTELTDGDTDKISPYWHDRRLLEKHSFLKPVRPQPSKNSSAFPLATEPTNGNVLICHNCLSTQWVSPEYKYDDTTEIYNNSLYINDNNSVCTYSGKDTDDFSTTVPYMVLGSAVGILIVSFMAWFVSQHVAWDLSDLWPIKSAAPPPESHVWYYIKYFGANVLHWMDVVYTKAYEILLMPRSGILHGNGDTDEPNRWWPNRN